MGKAWQRGSQTSFAEGLTVVVAHALMQLVAQQCVEHTSVKKPKENELYLTFSLIKKNPSPPQNTDKQ